MVNFLLFFLQFLYFLKDEYAQNVTIDSSRFCIVIQTYKLRSEYSVAICGVTYTMYCNSKRFSAVLLWSA